MTTEHINEAETPDSGRRRALWRLRKPHPVWWLNLAVMAAAEEECPEKKQQKKQDCGHRGEQPNKSSRIHEIPRPQSV